MLEISLEKWSKSSLRGDGDGEDMWTQGLFISMYDKIHYKYKKKKKKIKKKKKGYSGKKKKSDQSVL